MSGLDLGFLTGGSESTTNPSTVWSGQSQFLEDLYRKTSAAGQGTSGTDFAGNVQDWSTPGFQSLMGGGGMEDMTNLRSIAGGGLEQKQNQALGGAIDSGLGQISRNLERNIMPSINMGAVASGTSGGSRQGIAQGIAASDANQQSNDFVKQMMSDNFNSMQDRNVQGTLGAYQGLNAANNTSNTAMTNAMQFSPQMQNLGFNTQYGNLNNQANLYGAPTVLSGGGSSEQTRGLTQGFNDVFG